MAFKIGQKVVCVDDSIIFNYSKRYKGNPTGLSKNSIYTCGNTYVDSENDVVVYIEELQHAFLSKRFRGLDYDFVEELISNLKEEPIEV